jgi:hypothetical protein
MSQQKEINQQMSITISYENIQHGFPNFLMNLMDYSQIKNMAYEGV